MSNEHALNPSVDTELVTVLINKLPLSALRYELTTYTADTADDNAEARQLLSIDFIITGGEQYHDVTSMLYQPVVDVSVPEHGVDFTASVHNYFTSIPRLEHEEDTVDVHLELIESLV